MGTVLPHPSAKRFVQEAFRIGVAMRKALSIFSHRRRDAKSLIYLREKTMSLAMAQFLYCHALDEAASPRDGGSGLGGLCGLEETRRRKILV